MNIVYILYFSIGLAVGCILGYFLSKPKNEVKKEVKFDGSEKIEKKTEFPRLDIKMVIVIRKDKHFDRNTIGCICGRIALGTFERAKELVPTLAMFWFNIAQAKVVCSVNSEEELLQLSQRAHELNLANFSLTDQGIGIFGVVSEVDKVTGNLKLYN